MSEEGVHNWLHGDDVALQLGWCHHLFQRPSWYERLGVRVTVGVTGFNMGKANEVQNKFKIVAR